MRANPAKRERLELRICAGCRCCLARGEGRGPGFFPVHFLRTFSLQRLGPYDPTAGLSEDCFRKAFCYRGEPSAVQVCRSGDSLEVSAFGCDPEALLEETLTGLEQDDCYATFATDDSGVFRLHRRIQGCGCYGFHGCMT